MKLAGFLSVGEFNPTSYYVEPRFKDEERWLSPEVRFVQVGIALYMKAMKNPPTDVIIFATDEAYGRNGALLETEFAEFFPNLNVQFVTVPECSTRSEMYELFDIVTDALRDREHAPNQEENPKFTQYFTWDMTHGYRVQPALAQMMFHYLQSTFPKVQIQDFFYGAHKTGDLKRTRLISLHALWELNYWANAFGQFHHTGRTGYLSSLLKQRHNMYVEWKLGNHLQDFPQLGKLKGVFRRWDNAVKLNDIRALIGPKGIANSLYEALNEPWDVTTREAGRFIDMLREPMAKEFEPMLTNDEWWTIDGLRAQLEYMKWLHRHKRIHSFITVSREWLVTVIQWLLDCWEDRSRADHIYGALKVAQFDRDDLDAAFREDVERIYEALDRIGFVEDHAILISKIGAIRNYVSHAGIAPLGDVRKPGPNAPNVAIMGEALEKLEKLWEALEREFSVPSPYAATM